jgi:hypothetical protein
MRVLTPTRSPDDEAALRRVLKRERRAWHLSAFAEFAQLRRFTGWFTDAHPVAPGDGEHCVAAACARARWTRSRVMALWAARELDLLTTRTQENPLLPPPGSCWVDENGDVGCRWPELDGNGRDSSYIDHPVWTMNASRLPDRVHVIVRDLTAEECTWIGRGYFNEESRRRAEHLRDGGSIDTYPRGKS